MREINESTTPEEIAQVQEGDQVNFFGEVHTLGTVNVTTDDAGNVVSIAAYAVGADRWIWLYC